jgi:hypothetical protein
MAEELPKMRRPSLGTLQALKAKSLVVAKSREKGYAATQDLYTMAKFIFALSEEISEQTAVTHQRDKKDEIEMMMGELECVGVIFLFSFGSIIGHFVPYVRIGDAWYNGDNEVGFLRKRAGPPSVFMQYSNPSKTRPPHGIIADCMCFYVHPSLIRAARGDQNGTPIFGQTDRTCGPDSLQTTLMFADGFYDYYNQGLYSQLKRLLPARRPSTLAELKGNIQAFDTKKYLARLTSHEVTPESRGPIVFLLVMFSRYRQIEALNERAGEHFQVVPNTTKADMGAYPCEKLRHMSIARQPSPVYYAVSTNDAVILEELLDCGFDPNKTLYEQTPLYLAVRMGEIDLIKILLNYKNLRPEHAHSRGVLDLNLQSNGGFTGYTPLMMACHKISHKAEEYEDIIYLLVKHGADVNKTDEHGDTALILLCMKKSQDNYLIIPLVGLLLRNGTNVGHKNDDEEGALDYAQARDNQPLIELLQGGNDVEIMERHGLMGGGSRQTRRHRPNRRR